MINSLLRQLGLKVHLYYKRFYSFWKVKATGLPLRASFTALEREVFLNLWPVLTSNIRVVYDIGASVGIVSGCLVKIPFISVVHAFEPLPASFKRLANRMEPYSQVTCHNVALGDVNQQMKMKVMDNAIDSSSLLRMAALHHQEFSVSAKTHEESVTVVRLDDYVQQYHLPAPDLVKIDVQGFEDRVLRGGVNTIRKARYCLLEISFRPLYEGSPVFDDIYRQMRELGFQLFGVADILKGKHGTPLQIDGIFENERLLG
jgi:FkbM family methyltransferase